MTNGDSKVSLSYSKYRVIPDNPIWDDSDDDDDEYWALDDRKRHVDWYETAEKEIGALPKRGYKKVGDQIITKHDKEMSQRSNGRRIMEFPPGIQTGDGGGMDMQLSNAVYNKIRNFSIKEGKRKARVHDKEEKSTVAQAVDPNTKILLFKMVNNDVLKCVNGVISTGKEAVIMHAEGGCGPDTDDGNPLNIPHECAVKVFKTTLNEFKTRDKYIKDDYRFRDRFGKQNPRKIVHIWAEKELHNLMKMLKFGLRVPEPVLLKKHILVMSFIGRDGQPAPKIKDAILSRTDLEIAYKQTVTMMKQLYDDCHLVHADLSEYNILWHDKLCYMIDVSQSVEPNHPHGLEFLMRDCGNVSNFFSKKGVSDVMTPVELFNHVSGLNIEEGKNDAEILCQLRNYEKDRDAMAGLGGDDADTFNYCWDKSKSDSTNMSLSAAKLIPGHPKPKPGCKSGRSPRSPKTSLGKSPTISTGQSPQSPTASAFMSLTDDELKKLKDSFGKNDEDSGESQEATVVKFKDDDEFPPLS